MAGLRGSHSNTSLVPGGTPRQMALAAVQENVMELPALVARVRAEFLEMPGLRLSFEEATRLWGMDAAVCRTVVESLVQASFLRRAHDGTFLRAQS